MGAKRIFKRVALAVVLILLAAVLFAPTRATREVALRKYPHRIPVRFWHMWSAEWKDVVDKIVDRYNRSQDKYEVIALSIPSGADTKFLLGTVGGDPPDVMAQWNPVIPTWADSGLLTPFEEVMSPQEKALFDREAYPVVKRIGLYKGKTYGIPIGINVMAVFYLPEAFRKAGLDPDHFPATLEALSADGAKMDQRDAHGNLTRIGFLPYDWLHTAPLFGGGFYDFQKNRLSLGSEANLRCLRYLVNARKALGYDDVLRFQAGLNTASFAGGWPFIGGAYAAAVDGQWRVEQLAKYAPHLEYRTALLPPPQGGVPGAGLANGNFMVIPRSAKEKQGAWDFIKFWSGLTDPDRAAEFYVMGGWLPLSPQVAQAPAYRAYIEKYPQFKTFLDAVSSPNLQVIPPVGYQVFLNDEITKQEDLAVRGTISPDQAIRNLETDVAREIRRRKELGEND